MPSTLAKEITLRLWGKEVNTNDEMAAEIDVELREGRVR